MPSAFLGLGAGPGDREVYPNHDPHFTLDEEALPLGVAALCDCAARLLAQ